MLPALIAGGAALLGGFLNNRANARAAQRQMDFQEEMSNTSYQRGVEDMKAAGINPMLSAKVGGASTPVGSMPEIKDPVSHGISSAAAAVGMEQAKSQTAQNMSSARALDATAARTLAETQTEEAYRKRYELETEGIRQAGNLRFQQQVTEAQRPELVNRQTATEVARKELLSNQAAHEGVKFDVANTAWAADVAKRKAESRLMELAIPEAEAAAKFYGTDWGGSSPHVRQALEILKGLSSARANLRR